MLARRLSQFFALILAGLTLWFVISGAGPVEKEFETIFYIVFALIVAVLFAVLFFCLRWASGGSTVFWSDGHDQRNGVNRVTLLIAVILTIHLAVGWLMEMQGRLGETANIVGYLVWTLVPAAFAAFGFVKGPVRLQRASKSTMLIVGAIGLSLSAGYSWTKFARDISGPGITLSTDLLFSMANLIVAATTEEVVFRILLLTAILSTTKSRFNAVFISSVVFGLGHAPLYLMQPVIYSDWVVLAAAAQEYLPAFLLQTLMGTILGVVWLRSGSIFLVIITHAVFNIGPSMLIDF